MRKFTKHPRRSVTASKAEKWYICPECHNKTVVPMYPDNTPLIDEGEVFICNECGAEFEAHPLYNGEVKFTLPFSEYVQRHGPGGPDDLTDDDYDYWYSRWEAYVDSVKRRVTSAKTIKASTKKPMSFEEYCQATWGISSSKLTSDDKKKAEEEYHRVTKQPVDSAEETTRKQDRRLSPTSVRYRGYLIVLDRGGDGYNIYDRHRELEDAGYSSLASAKKCVDDIIREENSGIKAAEEADVDEYEDDIREISQEFTSENTSINSGKLPAIFKMIHLEPGTINIDYGGGKFDNVAEYLAPMDVVNLVYDPYNRTPEHNREVLRTIRKAGGADSATCSNVLNVIKEPEVRRNVLENIRRVVKPEGVVYITVYEGSGRGNEGPTKSGYQLNRKTADYLDEIKEVFPDAIRKGKLIIAHPSGSAVTSASGYTYVGEPDTMNHESGRSYWDTPKDWEGKLEAVRNLVASHPSLQIRGSSPWGANVYNPQHTEVFKFDFWEDSSSFDDQLADFENWLAGGSSAQVTSATSVSAKFDVTAMSKKIRAKEDVAYGHCSDFFGPDDFDDDMFNKLQDMGFIRDVSEDDPLIVVPKGTVLKYVGTDRPYLLYQVDGTDLILCFEQGDFELLFDADYEVVESATQLNSLRSRIYEYLDGCGGYTDYNQKIEDVSEEFGMSPDEAEEYVWDWSINHDAEWRDTVDQGDVEAASYGGAYDIADDDYFSKDELMEFAYSLEPMIQHLADDEYSGSQVYLSGVYLDNNMLTVVFTIDGAEHEGTVRIDKRRVRRIKDLYKYVTPLFEQIANSFWDYVQPEATEQQRKRWMDTWRTIQIPSYLSDLTSSRRVKGQPVQASLVETPQEVVNELIDILAQYDFILDPAFPTNPGKTWMGVVHLQVINETSHVPQNDFVALKDNVPRAMLDAIHDLEDRSNCPITWSFGVNESGQVTAGLDIMEQYIEDAETIMSATSISMKAIHDKILNAASRRMQKSDMGFPLSEIADYLIVEEEETEDGALQIEVRCELDYNGMRKLAEVLDPIVARYDKNAYFDMVAPGIMEAFIFNKNVTADTAAPIDASVYDFPEPPLEPPDHDEPEEHESIEYIVVDLDDDILVGVDTFDFQSIPKFEGEEVDWVLDEHPNIQVDHSENVMEHVLEVLEPQIPAEPGLYRVRGRVKLAYDVVVYTDYESEGPDDGAYVVDEDLTSIEFNYKKSSIENLEVGKD